MWPSSLTLAMTLTLNFQGQTWNLLYLNQKWSDCHEMKSKHIDWTLGLKCDHRVWPWPWPWPWIFKVNYGVRIYQIVTGVTSAVGVPSTHLVVSGDGLVMNGWQAITRTTVDQQTCWWCHIDGLVQERRNSIANALELRLSGTNPSIWWFRFWSKLVQVMMACRLMQWPSTNASWLLIGPSQKISVKLISRYKQYLSRKCIWKWQLQNDNLVY